jgi:catechol 2,3-dioxygenase-like lactoylglutathione lyase family enzyme
MNAAKVRGLNHLTLAVTDLGRSVAFYRDLLGCELRASWSDGAYLEAGSLWLCLSLDPIAASKSQADYTHYAFDVAPEHFEPLSARVRQHAIIWKENRSEGESLYFLDPDGHRLELHIGSLASRLSHYRQDPSKGVIILPPRDATSQRDT